MSCIESLARNFKDIKMDSRKGALIIKHLICADFCSFFFSIRNEIGLYVKNGKCEVVSMIHLSWLEAN